MTFAVLLKLFH